MQTEIEAKWLNINLNEIREKLKDVGAVCVNPERLMMRRAYDYPDKRLSKVGGWVRVRNEGDKISLSYKELNDRTLHGTKEISVLVDDFGKTCSFLDAIGLKSKAFQETKRESWEFGDVEIELDTWPWIPSFVEIEARNENELKTMAEKLGLDYINALHGSVELAYMDVYDVTEQEIDNWQEISFIDTPDWLLKRKIT